MVPCHRFSVLVSVTCTLMFVLIIFSSIKVAECPSFGKDLLTRLTICFLCMLTFFSFILFNFRSKFEGEIWVQIAAIPGHCLFVTYHIDCIFFFLCPFFI